MNPRNSRSLIAVLILVFSGATRGQQQPPSTLPSVTFQTEVNYVDVDTIVTDERGNFVGTLTKDDFEVREDGKVQKIDMFSTVDIPLVPRERFAFLNRPITTDVRSNREAFAGRVYVIVLDDLDISPMRTSQTRKAAREFVEKHLGANDVAAVLYTSGRTDAWQDFTGDPQLLLAAIDKFFGRRLRPAILDKVDQYYQQLAVQQETATDNTDPQNADNPPSNSPSTADRMFDPVDFERSYRAMGVLGTLKNLSEYLSTVRGRRKAVVMISEGIDYPMSDLFGPHSGSEVMRATQDAITAAARSNVNIFTVDPRGLVGMTTEFIEMTGTGMTEIIGPGATGNAALSSMGGPMSGQQDLLNEMRVSQDSLRTLADETGGFAAVNSNSMKDAFDRIVAANSRYYVLGYYPPSHPRNGAFHKIEVRVKQPGLKVLARKGYGSPRGKTPEERQRDDDARRAKAKAKGGSDDMPPVLRESLNSPMQQSGLTFAIQAAPFKGTDKEASVALAIEIDGGSLQFTQQNGLFADFVEISLFSVNEEGKPLKGTRNNLNLTLKPETYQRVKANGLRANPRISLPPGRYQVRVGAHESASGRLGSVFYDLLVPDFTKDPLMLSGMLLSAPSTEQAPTAQPDPAVAKLLPGSATGRREFLQTDTVSVLTEIYDNSSSRQPRQVDVAVRLLGESGQDVFVARDSLANTGDAKKWDVYAYTKQIPLKDVAPGRYLLRVEAQVRGNQNSAKPAARETLIIVK